MLKRLTALAALLGALSLAPREAEAACAATLSILDGTGASKTTCTTTDGGTGIVPSIGILGGTNNANKLSITSNSAALAEGVGTAGSAAGGVLTVQGVASMTPFLANPGTAANWAVGATGAAAPANASLSGVLRGGATGGFVQAAINCDNHVFKHITTATDTLAVQGVASQTIYVCGATGNAAGTATWFLENTASANANCSSTLTQITGVSTEAANTRSGFYNSLWGGLKNTSGNGLCINSTGTGGVDVDVWYAQF